MSTTRYSDGRGKHVDSALTHREALDVLAEARPDSWVLYWLHKYAADIGPRHAEAQAETNSAIQFLSDQFVLAVGYGLKRPMLRVHYHDQRFKVYLSKKGTICIKSGGLTAVGTHDPEHREQYIGCLLRGEFMQARLGDWDDQNRNRPLRPLSATEQDFLAKLQADVTGFLAQCSKDMCRCCYCNSPLEDDRSKTVGYGPVCAKHWGLPWGLDHRAMEAAPSFAKIHDANATAFCDEIRANPEDETVWAVFSDWLQERGLPPAKKPERGVTLPRGDSGGGKVQKRKAPETKPEPLSPWTRDSNGWTADASDLPKGEKACPHCFLTIMASQMQPQGGINGNGETTHWRGVHSCGEILTIVND